MNLSENRKKVLKALIPIVVGLIILAIPRPAGLSMNA